MMRALILLLVAAMLAAPASADKGKGKHNELPPGLQKNAARGKPLPPGWEKKLKQGAVLEADIYAHATIVKPVDSVGVITVRIDGKLLRLHQATREIVDILTD